MYTTFTTTGDEDKTLHRGDDSSWQPQQDSRHSTQRRKTGRRIQRLTHYFISTGITDASKQRSILLSICGPETYRLLRSLVGSAAEINAKSFEELVDILKQHYNPTPSVIIQRYKFNSRNRNDTETILQFLAALRSLAEYCNYG